MGPRPRQRQAPRPERREERRAPFRFSFSATGRYHAPGGPDPVRPLFRRWEATGLLLLVTVGGAFLPAGRGEPAVGTVLVEAAATGDLRARFFSLAPPLLAFLAAWRAAGRLSRPFRSFAPVAVEVTLSAVLVFVAFHLGLFLALQNHVRATASASPWEATLPGAILGWALILVVASIRLLWGRAAADRKAARQARNGPSGGDSSPPEE